MIYLFSGLDEFRIRERIHQIYADLEIKYPRFNYIYREGNKITLEELQQILATQQLLTTHQLVVINNLLIHTTNQISQWLSDWLESEMPPEIDLILIESEPLSSRSKWVKYFKNWQLESYTPLLAIEARDWLVQRIKKFRVKCSPLVIQQLITNFGSDLWRISNELDKLILFADGQIITPAVLKKLTNPALPDNIWLAIDALANKNIQLANKLLNTQIMLGASETELLSTVAYQFRNIITIKTLIEKGVAGTKISNKTGLHPYVVKKSLSFANKFTWQQLQRIFYLLQKIDTAIKQSKTPSRVGLDILIAQMTNC